MSELELYMQIRYGYYALMVADVMEDENIRYWIREKNVECLKQISTQPNGIAILGR